MGIFQTSHCDSNSKAKVGISKAEGFVGKEIGQRVEISGWEILQRLGTEGQK